MVPGNDRAKRAGAVLEEIGKGRPEEVIAALSDKSLTTTPDAGVRLETLGKVMNQSGKFTEQGKEALLQGLASPHKQTRESAARGVVESLGKLNGKDITEVVNRPSPELSAELARNVDRIPGPVGRELAKRLTESITEGTGQGVKDRVTQQANMLGSLGRFVGPHDIAALGRLAGTDGLKNIEKNLRQDVTLSDGAEVKDTARDLQKTVGKALLNIADSSLDEGGRSRAISTLADKDWGLSVREDQGFKKDLETFGKKHADNPTVSDAVSRMSLGAEKPTLAGQFRGMGVPLSDSVIARLTDRAVTKLGAAKVQEVVNRIGLFNALPPDARAKVSGSSDTIDEGEKLNLSGKSVDAKTFATLPADVRKEINGDQPLKPDEKLRVDKEIKLSAAEFNRLPVESRRALNGDDRFLKPPDKVQVPSTIDAKTFNALPSELRKELSGTDKPLREAEKLDLTNKSISNKDINLLPAHLREKITGSRDAQPSDGFVMLDKLKGKSIEAADFNQLPADLRKRLNGGKEDQLFEGERLPDLSLLALDAERFNQLPADVRRTITGTSQLLEKGQSLNLSGKTFDAQTFNALPESLRKSLNGGTDLTLAADKTFSPKPADAKVSAEVFNSLPENARRLLTGVDKIPGGAVSLRGVELTAETFNRLPEDLRTALTGSAEKWPAGRVARDLSGKTIGAETFNKLSPEVRSKLTETERTIDPTRALMMMANGTLDAKDSPLKFLTGNPPLGERVSKLAREASDASTESVRDLRRARFDVDGKLNGLKKNANESLGMKWALDLLGDYVEHESRHTLPKSKTGLQVSLTHNGKQEQAIFEVKDSNRRLSGKGEEVGRAALRTDRLDLAKEVGRYSE
ncbi:MAG: hypothetical protein K2Z81_23765, partial [Cyanobacteria bacterium]|nr:hypothetical protein [Cyanobacteriota bacterium]